MYTLQVVRIKILYFVSQVFTLPCYYSLIFATTLLYIRAMSHQINKLEICILSYYVSYKTL